MDLLDSKNVNNRIRKRSIALAIFVHFYLTIFTLGFWLLLLAIFGLTTSTLLRNDIDEAKSSANSFNKTFPFKYFGQVFGHFQHIYHHPINIDSEIVNTIEEELKVKTPIQRLEALAITDRDKDLNSAEGRNFLKGESKSTERGTTLTLILNQSTYGSVRSFEWRVMAGGYVDKNAKFNLIAYSPFTLHPSPFTFFFWIMAYIKREENLLNRVRTIYPSSYNDIDVATAVRSINETVFDAMVVALEKNGIDTSDLKAQKMQTMNINISGGKVNMGNVVQGAMNKISNAVKGAKA